MDLLHLLQFQTRFIRSVELHFFHHPALYAAILDRLGNPAVFPPGVAIYCPERGRVRYRAGDPYRFAVALHPCAATTAASVAELVKRPAQTSFGQTSRAPFGDSYEVDKVLDLVSGETLKPTPFPLTGEMIRPISEQLAAQSELTIRFLSPLFILRTPVASKEFIMDGELFEPRVFLDRVLQSARQWWPELSPTLPDTAESARVELVENRLIRADVTYPKKRLLGAAGSIRLRFYDSVGAWAMPLLLAGIVGVGKATNMGQGRFELIGYALPVGWPPKPAKTILERAACPENLTEVRGQIAASGNSAGVDHVELDEFIDSLTYQTPRLASALESGTLPVSALRGLLIREKKRDNGQEKVRPLAIPTLQDRYWQRAVLNEIAPAAEQLWEDSSFAYRKGLSYKTAQRRVAQAERDGFKYVFDADIRAFFDEVDWDKLRIRLEGFWGSDPVVDVLMNWVKAPVSFEGRIIERHKGLPQGSVVSPLLANLYLDVLDEAIEVAGFRLVRYADDFVVLTKNEKEAARVKPVVTEALHQLGLSLNEAKSKETSLQEGFEYLGALFCRSVVLCVDRDSRAVTAVLDHLPDLNAAHHDVVDVSGWLTDFIAQRTADADQNESEKPGASVTSTLYVVVTNVRASERQQQVREILRFHGTEVRSCVYEVVASDTSIKRIQEELSYVLRPEDDVRIYRICENCRAASVVFGDSELASPPVAIIV